MDAVANKIEAPVAQPAPRAEEKTAPKSKRKPLLIVAGIAAVVLLGLGIYLLVTAGKESTDDAQVDADIVPLGARVGGLVLKVRVTDNKEVKKGDVLMELDDADYVARLQQAEAELETAQAQAQAADAQAQVIEAGAKGGFSSAKAAVSGSSVAVANADAQIAAARATLTRAQSDAHRSDLDLQRNRELLAAKAVPQERFDNAQSAFDSAQAAVEQAKAQLRAAEEGKRGAISRVAEAQGRFEASTPIDSQIAAAHAQANLAHARVKSAQAQLDIARLNLSYTKVTAPADGFVSKLSVHEGQLLQMGQPLAELVPKETYLVANFKETQVGDMRPGQRVEVSVDAFGGKTIEGKVDSLSGGTGARFSLLPADNASGNFVKVVQRVPVRISFTHVPDGLTLRSGLSAEATVHVK